MAIKTVARSLGAGGLVLAGTLLSSWGLVADVVPGTPRSLIGLRPRPPVASPLPTTPPSTTAPSTTQSPGSSPADATNAPLPPLGEVDPVPAVAAVADRRRTTAITPAPQPAFPGDLFQEPADADARAPGPTPNSPARLAADVEKPPQTDPNREGTAPEGSHDRASGAESLEPAVTGRAAADANSPPVIDSAEDRNSTGSTEDSASSSVGDSGRDAGGDAGGDAGRETTRTLRDAGGASRTATADPVGNRSQPARETRRSGLLSLRGETTPTSVRQLPPKRTTTHPRSTPTPATGAPAGSSPGSPPDNSRPARGSATTPAAATPAAATRSAAIQATVSPVGTGLPGESAVAGRLTLVADETVPPAAPAAELSEAGTDLAIDRLQQPLRTIPTQLQARRLARVQPPGRAATTPEYESLFERSAPVRQSALALHLPPPRRSTYDFRHRPLYFEQPGLERCGRSYGCATSVVSATAFLAQSALLPYQVLALGPCTEVSPLGDCPCGTLYPWCAVLPQPGDCQFDTLECDP